jgi:hypothetical protein
MRSFRIFALSAPALHSDSEPEAGAAPHRAIPLHTVASDASRSVLRPKSASNAAPRRLIGTALAMAAAAALALYIARPPRANLEDAIGDEIPSIELTAYSPAENVFAQEMLDQDATAQDSLLEDRGTDTRNDIAG